MALGAFHFSTDTQRRKFLFSAWGRNEVDFWTAAQKMTLNTALYEKIRGAVEQKLGAQALDFIAALNIR